jgi:hypothetical protein
MDTRFERALKSIYGATSYILSDPYALDDITPEQRDFLINIQEAVTRYENNSIVEE